MKFSFFSLSFEAMTKEAAFRTLYSITIFIIVFSILNFYIKLMKEERVQIKFKELQKEVKLQKELKFKQEFLYCEKSHEACCKASELFLLKIN